MSRVIDRDNFHIKTFGIFSRCRTPATKPDFVSNTGSKYWFVDDDQTLVRQAHHWTHKIRSCAWILNLGQDKQSPTPITARIKFSDLTEQHSALSRKSFLKRKKYKRRAKAIFLQMAA